MGESAAGDGWTQRRCPNLFLHTCRREVETETPEGTAAVRTHVRLWAQQLSIPRSLRWVGSVCAESIHEDVADSETAWSLRQGSSSSG